MATDGLDRQALRIGRTGVALGRRLGYSIGLAGMAGAVWLAATTWDALWNQPTDVVLLLLIISPLLALAAWAARQALVRPWVVVRPDSIEIRHPRILRRPLVLARSDVRAVHLDDGSFAGVARFPSGDDSEPFLWTSRWPSDVPPGRALIGDRLEPNLAIELVAPRPIAQARSSLVALTDRGEPDPPDPDEPVDLILVALEEPARAPAALAGWRLVQPDGPPLLPAEVRPGTTEQQLAWFCMFAALLGGAPLVYAGRLWVIPIQAVLVVAALAKLQRGWGRGGREAMAVADAAPADRRAAARAAAKANWGPHAPE